MRTKMISIPFDLELAKKITNGEIEGRIVTREGRNVRVICWDKKDKDYPIVCLVNDDFEENIKTYTTQGEWNTCKSCAIIKNDLSLEVPEYMTFKDGDILISFYGNPFIYNGKTDGEGFGAYCGIDTTGKLIFNNNNCNNWTSSIEGYANENQRDILKGYLKRSDCPESKVYLKNFFGSEEKPEYEFTPFEKVLVKNFEGGTWTADIFSYNDTDGSYVCVGGLRSYCIPYNNETAHLLGTTKNYE